MNNPLLWIVAGALSLCPIGTGKALAERPPLQLQAFQGRTIEADKERVYNATFTVLQDLGCTITSAEIRTGYISALGPQTLFGPSTEFNNLRVTAFVLPIGKNKARVRLSVLRHTAGIFVFRRGEYVVEESQKLYEHFFARIVDNLATQKQVWGED